MATTKDQIIGKMQEQKIKNFSDKEIKRVFKDTVMEKGLIKVSKELIKTKQLKINEVVNF